MQVLGRFSAVIALVAVAAVASAQDRATDEKVIRDLIAQFDTMPGAQRQGLYTPDAWLWSGTFKRPFMRGQGTPDFVEEPMVRNQVPGSEQRKTTVRRLEVAQGGDMAYEFSDVELSFRLNAPKGPRPDIFTSSDLRVWKKVNGRWLIAAHSSHAHDTPGRVRAFVQEEQGK
jgi:ketosteroid isomerase-like protein